MPKSGNAGAEALCDALGKGALEALAALQLSYNRCDEGVVARLAEVTNLRAHQISRARATSAVDEAGGEEGEGQEQEAQGQAQALGGAHGGADERV